MKKNSLITAAAVAVAGVAAYFIRKKIVARNKTIEEPSSGDSRHVTNAFSRAKSYASGMTDEV